MFPSRDADFQEMRSQRMASECLDCRAPTVLAMTNKHCVLAMTMVTLFCIAQLEVREVYSLV